MQDAEIIDQRDDLESDDEVGGAPQDPDKFFAANAFRIVFQTNNFFLPQIRDLVDKGEAINLRPEYQRRLRWTNQQKSKLIESLLLNIPIPPVFFYESDAARYEVMDGQQRLNTIREFFSGSFALSGLTVLAPLNGIRYPKCPPRIKRALDRGSISAIVLLLESESERPESGHLKLTDIRRFVFDRLNTGGKKLNAQEIRNALNPGPMNEMIVELSRFSLFTTVFGIPEYTEADPSEYYENPKRQKNSLYSSMRDCELVLRFFALRDAKNIRGSMKSMLDRAMERGISSEEKDRLKEVFQLRLSFLYEIFEGKPFLLPPDASGRRKVSTAMYDASMVAIDSLWAEEQRLRSAKNEIQESLEQSFADSEKLEILTGRGNTADAVRERIELMKGIISAPIS